MEKVSSNAPMDAQFIHINKQISLKQTNSDNIWSFIYGIFQDIFSRKMNNESFETKFIHVNQIILI